MCKMELIVRNRNHVECGRGKGQANDLSNVWSNYTQLNNYSYWLKLFSITHAKFFSFFFVRQVPLIQRIHIIQSPKTYVHNLLRIFLVNKTINAMSFVAVKFLLKSYGDNSDWFAIYHVNVKTSLELHAMSSGVCLNVWIIFTTTTAKSKTTDIAKATKLTTTTATTTSTKSVTHKKSCHSLFQEQRCDLRKHQKQSTKITNKYLQ